MVERVKGGLRGIYGESSYVSGVVEQCDEYTWMFGLKILWALGAQ